MSIGGSRPPLVAKIRVGAAALAMALAYSIATVESFHQSDGLMATIPANAPGFIAATWSANNPPNEWPARIVEGSVR